MLKTTITIGIPAHNEAKNVGNLLSQLVLQKLHNIVIQQIFVYSDGSTDNTVQLLESIKNKLIKVVDNRKRQGISYALNQILKNCHSDLLLLLDADISITDPEYINKITMPIIKHKADLVSTQMVELEPTNFYSRMLWVSQQVKNNVFNQINNGNNIFNCKGPARAFSKKLYKHIIFPKHIANDAYSYLRCHELGMKFNFVKNTEVNYKLVDNFSDHQKQSSRFFHSVRVHLSPTAIILGLINSLNILLKYPIHSIAYLFVIFYIKIKSLFQTVEINSWQMATSSK